MPPKKRYGEWLKCKKPIPPKSSRYRFLQDQIDNNSSSSESEAQEPVNVDELDPAHFAEPIIHSPPAVQESNDENMDVNEDRPPADQDLSSDEDVTSSSLDSSSSLHPEPDAANTSKLDTPLFPGLLTTKFECYFLCLHFLMREGLTTVALGHLLELINCLFPVPVIQPSLFIFHKLFQGSFTVQFHFYCPNCNVYIGQKSDFGDAEKVVCPVLSCNTEICFDNNTSDGSFFIYLPMTEQLKNFCETTPDIWKLLSYRTNRPDSADICDIFDGALYKKHSLEGEILSHVRNFSLTCSTDGSPVFKSGKNSLWPIQVRVNEVPPADRFSQENSLVVGLWFGKSEPVMSTFLIPFLKEAKTLYEDGFTWTDPCNKESVNSKVVLLNCVVDSVAKPKVQGTKQFNGYYGCGFCYHPGVMVDGHPHPRYTIDTESPMNVSGNQSCSYKVTKKRKDSPELQTFDVFDRSDLAIREEMIQVTGTAERDVKGVVEKSPFFALLFFDLVFGFCVDYMHAVLIGVCKFVTNLMLDSSSNGKGYYIGREIDRIDKRLAAMKPPLSISRRPRSLKERAHWKANEWRAYLLFYSLPCLAGILKPQYFKHYCLLVTAIYILLQDRISLSELKKAALYLRTYVSDFQKLYDKVNMSFNVHLLLHLPRCVYELGPLWSFSAFWCETGNGSLVRLVKGTKAVASQIAKKYSMFNSVPYLLKKHNVQENILEYCSDIMSYRLAKDCLRREGITLLDSPKNIPLSNEEAEALQIAGYPNSLRCYERMIQNGVKYHARCYQKQGRKSCDSFAKLQDGSFVVMERILVPTRLSKSIFALVKEINVERRSYVSVHVSGANAPHIKVCSSLVFGKYKVIDCATISRKVVRMDLGADESVSYIAEMPNFFEKD